MSGAEILLGLTGPLGQLWTVFEDLLNRWRQVQENEHDVHELSESVENCREKIGLLCGHLGPATTDESLFPMQDIVATVEKRQEVLLEEQERLYQLRHNLARRGPIRKMMRATRTKEAIEKSQGHINNIVQNTASFQETAGACLLAMHLYNSLGEESKGVPVTRGIGKPAFIVPATADLYVPPWVRIDFNLRSSTQELATLAGKIRYSLLKGAHGACSQSHHHTVIQITGDSGIGKSCAIRGLIRDEDGVLQNMYCNPDHGGGIHYFSWGSTVTKSQIIYSLAERVEDSGGAAHASRIRAGKCLLKAVCLLIEWFEGRDCLFFVDEEDHPDWADITTCLVHLSKCSYSSAVVFSRQNNFIRNMGNVIHLRADPQGIESKWNFVRAAGLSESCFLNGECSRYLEDALEICGGYVICLNNMGNCIRLAKNIWKKTLSETLRMYLWWYRRLVASGDCEHLSSNHRTYGIMISIQLKVLNCLAIEECLPLHISSPHLSERFISFCVLRREEWVPYRLLFMYWNLRCEQEAEDICRHLLRGRLGYHEQRRFDGSLQKGFRLHHRGIEYCRAQAFARGDLDFWHQRRAEVFPDRL